MSTAWQKIFDRLLALQKSIASNSATDGEKAETRELIAELVASKSRRAAIHLFSFLLVDDFELAKYAAEAIKQLTSNLTASEWLYLEERVRGSLYNYTRDYRDIWDAADKDSILSLLNRFPDNTCLIGLASMHGNGHIRERCVYALDKIKDGSELPFLLLRATDWVEEVRTPAKSAIDARLKKENSAHFVRNIALIDKLKLRKRGDAARILRLSSELAMEAPTSEFVSQLNSFDLQARRLCMYQGLARPDRLQIIEQGLKNSDHQVRQIAYMAGVPQFLPDRRLDVIKSGLTDRLPSNRREVLRMASLHFPERFDELVQPSLMDRSSKVRTLARFLWKEKHEDFDFSKYYRERIAECSGAELAAAIRGLCDAPQQEDYALIEKFLSDKNVRIKKTAIDSIVLINKEKSVDILLKFLAAEEPGLLSTIKKNLLSCNWLLSGEDLWRVFPTCKQMSTRKCILNILATLPKWEQLGYFLIAYANKNEEVSKLALSYLKRWQDRFRQSWVFTQPNQTQAERIRLAASLVGPKLDIPKYREIQLVFESLKVTVID